MAKAKATTFTAKIDGIKKCENMWELRLVYKHQPDWIWMAAKLFRDSKIWIEGEDLDLTDPWADPNKIKTKLTNSILTTPIRTHQRISQARPNQQNNHNNSQYNIIPAPNSLNIRLALKSSHYKKNNFTNINLPNINQIA